MNSVNFIHKNLLAPLLILKPATVSCFRRLKCHKMTDQARDYGRADAVFNGKNWALGRYSVFSAFTNCTKLQKEQTTKTYKSHQFAHQFGAGQHVLIMYHENRLWKATSFGKKSQKLCCWCLVHSNSVPPARSPSLAGAYTTWTNQGTLFVLV